MEQLVEELGRGLAGLQRRELVHGAMAAAAMLAVVRVVRGRDLPVRAPWPVLFVGAVAIGVREPALLPLAAAALGWWLGDRMDLAVRRRAGPLLVAAVVTALGLYGTLPETEEALVLFGVVLVVAVVGPLARLLDLGEALVGAHVGGLLGLLVWVVVAGDGQRWRAALAGLLCVAMLAAVAVVHARSTTLLMALHVGVTLAASRWVGLAADAGSAVVRTLPVLGVAILGVLLLHRRAADTQPSG